MHESHDMCATHGSSESVSERLVQGVHEFRVATDPKNLLKHTLLRNLLNKDKP